MNQVTPVGTDDRRARLLAAKLAAIVRDRASGATVRPASFPLGAALLSTEGDEPDGAWVLLDTTIDDGTGLGAALVFAVRNGAARLDLVSDVRFTVAARRATEFRLPIDVWTLDGRELLGVTAAPVAPPPLPRSEHLRFVDDIVAAGATVVVEHGVVRGEVRGLEVCRVVDVADGESTGVRLEVGVGVHDREAFAIIHGDVPTSAALAGVVAAVRAARTSRVPGHPLNRLAPERLLRWCLEQQPWLVGMASVRPANPPVPRRGLRDRAPCTAVGQRLDGSPVVIVCSVGGDLDVIPYAADARLAAAMQGEAGAEPEPANAGSTVGCLVVVPERDLLAVTKQLAGELRHSLSLMPLADWSASA